MTAREAEKAEEPSAVEAPAEHPIRAEVKATIVRAQAAQRLWGELSVRERARRLEGVQRALITRAEEIVHSHVDSDRKNLFESWGLMLTLSHLLSWFRKTAPKVLGERRMFPFFGLARAHRLVREPYGVVGIIAPWNYPYTLALEPLFAAVVAGNAVVLKPSEHATDTGLRIADLFREGDVPEDLVQVVTGGPEAGRALVESGIDRLVFTGSVAAGRKVAALAAEELIPCTLELGGKDAAIVLGDADLERAAAGIAWGATFNAGQACLAIERVYVVESVADDFVERVTDHMKRLRVGPGADPDTDLAAIATDAQLELIQAHVEDARAKGATIACGGARASRAGRFYEPTVIVDATDDMSVMREETFGPVIAIQRVPDEDEAVRRTNASPFGLTCSIWTNDVRRGRTLAKRIRGGDIAINDHGAPAGLAEVPWGGVKDSGYGRTRGVDGLLAMTTTKHVSWPRVRARRELYWYPYSAKKVGAVRSALFVLYGTWRDRWAVLTRRR